MSNLSRAFDFWAPAESRHEIFFFLRERPGKHRGTLERYPGARQPVCQLFFDNSKMRCQFSIFDFSIFNSKMAAGTWIPVHRETRVGLNKWCQAGFHAPRLNGKEPNEAFVRVAKARLDTGPKEWQSAWQAENTSTDHMIPGTHTRVHG